MWTNRKLAFHPLSNTGHAPLHPDGTGQELLQPAHNTLRHWWWGLQVREWFPNCKIKRNCIFFMMVLWAYTTCGGLNWIFFCELLLLCWGHWHYLQYSELTELTCTKPRPCTKFIGCHCHLTSSVSPADGWPGAAEAGRAGLSDSGPAVCRPGRLQWPLRVLLLSKPFRHSALCEEALHSGQPLPHAAGQHRLGGLYSGCVLSGQLQTGHRYKVSKLFKHT